MYPDVFGTLLVPKEPELIATPYRFEGDTEAANRHFETGLVQAFTAMRAITEYSYPLTVFYAFKQSEVAVQDDNQSVSSTGWETMLEGLINHWC